MEFAQFVFLEYITTVLKLILLAIWGLGILYTLAKIRKYERMIWGTLGCLGMAMITFGNLVLELPAYLGVLLPMWSYIAVGQTWLQEFWQTVSCHYQPEFVITVLQIFVVVGLTGRIKAGQTQTVPSSNIDATVKLSDAELSGNPVTEVPFPTSYEVTTKLPPPSSEATAGLQAVGINANMYGEQASIDPAANIFPPPYRHEGQNAFPTQEHNLQGKKPTAVSARLNQRPPTPTLSPLQDKTEKMVPEEQPDAQLPIIKPTTAANPPRTGNKLGRLATPISTSQEGYRLVQEFERAETKFQSPLDNSTISPPKKLAKKLQEGGAPGLQLPDGVVPLDQESAYVWSQQSSGTDQTQLQKSPLDESTSVPPRLNSRGSVVVPPQIPGKFGKMPLPQGFGDESTKIVLESPEAAALLESEEDISDKKKKISIDLSEITPLVPPDAVSSGQPANAQDLGSTISLEKTADSEDVQQPIDLGKTMLTGNPGNEDIAVAVTQMELAVTPQPISAPTAEEANPEVTNVEIATPAQPVSEAEMEGSVPAALPEATPIEALSLIPEPDHTNQNWPIAEEHEEEILSTDNPLAVNTGHLVHASESNQYFQESDDNAPQQPFQAIPTALPTKKKKVTRLPKDAASESSEKKHKTKKKEK